MTGGAGFIGTNFIHYWIERHPNDRIIVLDALTYAGNKSNLESFSEGKNFTFIRGSICDQNLVNRVFKEHKINRVVNFAAESHVDRSILGPDDFVNTNIWGTYTLLKTAKIHWLDNPCCDHLFHHVSTDEVYGSLKSEDVAFNENHPYAPNSPYSATKAASDHLVRAYNKTYGLKVTTSNCSNNYGAFQYPEKLIPLCLINILEGKPLPIYGDGSQVRDWLHVDDHCRGIELIIEKGTRGQTYNIGGDNERKNIDVVSLICSSVNRLFQDSSHLAKLFPRSPCARGEDARCLITYVEDRLGHDTRYAINAAKIKSELNYSPSHTFESGIRGTIDWYIKNTPWWISIKKRSKNSRN